MTETINPFVSENYKTNFDSLRKAIEAGNVIKAGKQYNKTVSVLSEALEGLTDRAEDVAKHVIRSDLGKYKEPIGKKPSGFISRLIERLKKILRIEASTESRMNDFIKTLPKNSSEVTWEINKKYTETFSKIADLERSKEKQQKNLLDEVNSVSKEEHDPKRRDSGYDTEEEYGYNYISSYERKEGNNPDLQDKLSVSGFTDKQIEKILTLTPPPVPKKTPGAYISLDAPDVNWGSDPGKVEEVMKANISTTPEPTEKNKPIAPPKPQVSKSILDTEVDAEKDISKSEHQDGITKPWYPEAKEKDGVIETRYSPVKERSKMFGEIIKEKGGPIIPPPKLQVSKSILDTEVDRGGVEMQKYPPVKERSKMLDKIIETKSGPIIPPPKPQEVKETRQMLKQGTASATNDKASSVTQVNAERVEEPKRSHGLSIKDRIEMLKQGTADNSKAPPSTGVIVSKIVEQFERSPISKGR